MVTAFGRNVGRSRALDALCEAQAELGEAANFAGELGYGDIATDAEAARELVRDLTQRLTDRRKAG